MINTCNRERIECFLRNELTTIEQDAFEQHLSECPTCRLRLEQSAAETSIWNEASDFLRDRPFDLSPLSDLTDPSIEIPVDDEQDSSFELQHILKLMGPTDDPEKLGRIGSYEVAGIIGTGGMGIVLKAFDTALNRFVAIKLLAPHLASSAAARRRFAREAQAAAAVVHENVLAIHGVDTFNGLPYLVMPYIRGISLETRLRQDGPLPIPDVLRIGMQTAAGLAAAHAQGLVHRDIKPSNILLTDGVGRVAITDFGLARTVDDASLTRTGVIAGTPQYMSPEQARGEAVGRRSDLFSLGSVLYAMCTGHAPFRAETSYAVLRRITDSQSRSIQEINSEVPDWLVAIVHKLHRKAPEARLASASQVANLLERCLAHVQRPGVIELPAEVSELQRQSRRTGFRTIARDHWKAFAAAVLLTVLGCLTVLILPKLTETPTQEPSTAASPVTGAVDSESEPITWDDSIDHALDMIDLELSQLEQNIE